MDAPGKRAGLIPLERELHERLKWLIKLRWMAAGAICVGVWFATTVIAPGLSPLPLYGVGLFVVAYNAAFSLSRRRLESIEGDSHSYRRHIYHQIGLDWIALIFLVHHSGGIQSPVVLAFTFHLILGAILLSRRACYLQAAFAIAISGLLALLEGLAIWEPTPVTSLYLMPPYGQLDGLYRWLHLSALFAVTAFLITSIILPLRRKEEALFQSERERDAAYHEMAALHRLGQAVNSTLDMERVLDLIAENGATIIGMKGCSLRLLDSTGKYLEIGGVYGLSQDYLDKGAVEVAKSRIDAEGMAGRVIQVTDVRRESQWIQYPEEAQREGILSLISVPMEAMGRLIGTLRVYSSETHDFTEKEVDFLKSLANLGAVAIENVRDYNSLQALNEERAWFARTTHHQLRAPLAAIKGLLDALPYAGPVSEKQTELLSRGRRRIEDLLDMIRDLLDMAAAQRPFEASETQAVNLMACLQNVVETARDRAADKGVEFHVQVSSGPVLVYSNAEDLQRIFSNLLENGVKYTPQGGRVQLQVDLNEKGMQARVDDTGIGIAEKEQARVFEGFYRTVAAKATGEIGTGLGLAIVKQLIERWRGTLELTSRRGKGSSFVVTLPAVRESEAK